MHEETLTLIPAASIIFDPSETRGPTGVKEDSSPRGDSYDVRRTTSAARKRWFTSECSLMGTRKHAQHDKWILGT